MLGSPAVMVLCRRTALCQGGESRGSKTSHRVFSSGMTGSYRARGAGKQCLSTGSPEAANGTEQRRVKIKFPISWL